MNLGSATKMLLNLATSPRYQVDGNSMAPTLLNGQYVIVSSWQASQGSLLRGDIVLLRQPVQTHRLYIKRIVGLPDECIRLEDSVVSINDSPLSEPYLSSPGHYHRPSPPEVWLGPGEYFVLGDNRNESLDDSRAFGYVRQELIVGRVWFRYWPLRAWGKID